MTELTVKQPWEDLPLEVRTDSVARMLRRNTITLSDPAYMTEYELQLQKAIAEGQTEEIKRLKAELAIREQTVLRQHPDIGAMILLQAPPIAERQSLSEVTDAVKQYAVKYIAPRLIPPPNSMETFVPPSKTSFHIG